MRLDRGISPLVAVTRIELTIGAGLGAPHADLFDASKDAGLILRPGLADCVAVPLVAGPLPLAVYADPHGHFRLLILDRAASRRVGRQGWSPVELAGDNIERSKK